MVGFLPPSIIPYVTEYLRKRFNEALRMSEPARTERLYEVYKQAKEESPEFANFLLDYHLKGATKVEEKKGGGIIGGILGENWQLLVGAVLVIVVLSFFRK